MNFILIFMLNFSGAIGPSWGYYAPSLCSINIWLEENEKQRLPTTCMVFGGAMRVDLMRPIAGEVRVEYYKGESLDKAQRLVLVPIDLYLTYKIMILPLFLYSYTGGGIGMCHVELKGVGKEEDLPMIVGPVIKTGIEFIPTPNFGVEISFGYRFLRATPKEVVVPVNLYGGYFNVTFERILK